MHVERPCVPKGEAKCYKDSFWKKQKPNPLKYRKKETFPGVYED